MHKYELRQQIRQIKRQFSRQQLEELSFPIVTRLKERLKDVQTVVAYYPLPDEVDIRQLLDDLVSEGKKVFLPKVLDDETMVCCPYMDAQHLFEGAFHILEPEYTEGTVPFGYSGITQKEPSLLCMLVPGVAFDAAGHRLGRGKGYYDRFLADYPYIYKIGVCFDFQKVSEVPTDEYDIPVDEVI